MNLKDRESWKKVVEANKDPYGKACIDTSREVMKILDKNEDFDPHQIICDGDENANAGGVTGYMAGMVAQIVSKCHERGEEFRLKWNGQYKDMTRGEDKGGVVNPAIVTIETRGDKDE